LRRIDATEWFTATFGPALVLLTYVNGRRPIMGVPLAVNLAVGVLVLLWLPRLRAHRTAVGRYLGLGLPLLAFYLYYRGLGAALTAPNVVWHDALFLGLERPLWAASPPVAGWLRAWLMLAYHAYVPLLLAAAAAAFGAGDRAGCRRMEQMVAAVCLSWAACFVVFVLFPVMGPRFVYPDLQWDRMGSGALARFASFYQREGMLVGAAFPSAHLAGVVAVVAPLWRWRRIAFWILLPVALSLAGGAVYFGYHYVTDVVGGAALGAAALALIPAVPGRETAGSPIAAGGRG
jgi:membrane-associated phospholipid phosphatase